MYTHAVQSLVFNRCCSFRLSPPNLPVVMLGDLVGVGAASGGDSPEERGPGDVVEVTTENISQYTLADVVLPLPGKDVQYPSNSTGEEYKRVLDELDIASAFTGSHVKELNLSGAYRRIVCMPQGDPHSFLSCDLCRCLYHLRITLIRLPFTSTTSTTSTTSATSTTPFRPHGALYSLHGQRPSAAAH